MKKFGIWFGVVLMGVSVIGISQPNVGIPVFFLGALLLLLGRIYEDENR